MPQSWYEGLFLLAFTFGFLGITAHYRDRIRWLVHEFRRPIQAMRWLFYPRMVVLDLLALGYLALMAMYVLYASQLLSHRFAPSTNVPGWEGGVLVFAAAVCVASLVLRLRAVWQQRHQRPAHDGPESAGD